VQPGSIKAVSACPLCEGSGGRILAQTSHLRVIWPDEPDHPGLLRVIWRGHVAEMSDLDPADRLRLMEAVWTVESAMRSALAPDKINLASLGNMVPHLHWHVIPRWRDDPQFPASIWTPCPDRAPGPSEAIRQRVRARLDALFVAVAAALEG
jgi:diadenosine tetraphosphate (Ap4A) HIT family hydrolase